MGISRRSCLVALLAVIVSVTSEKCNTVLDGQLLVGEEGTIWRLNPEDNSHEAYISAESPIKLSYSYARNTLYYSDLNTRQVYALKDKSTKARAVVAKQGEWLPWSITVDDVNDKLYLIESFAGVVHVYDLKSGDGIVVIGTNITEPKDVDIDAGEGYLFVLDKHQILRAELDGSNPTPIYQEFTTINQLFNEYSKDFADALINSIKPKPDRSEVYRKSISIADLTVDVKSKRIFWVDTLKRTVESSDYNGENKKVHFQDTSVDGIFESFASLTFLNGAIYWADDVTKKVFKIVGDKSDVILNGVESHAITAVDCEKQPQVDNPCANNQCQQFCLLSKSSQTGYSCACDLGLELADDGKSCVTIEDFILFTEETYLRGQSLSGDHKDIIEPSRFSLGKGALIDFDANSGIVYYSSLFPDDKLHEIRLKSVQTKTLSPDLLSKNTGNFAYDWTTKNLYYLTYYYADATTLNVMNVDDPTYSKVLIKNVPRLVRGLVVHPNKGYVFFARLDELRGQQSHGSISRLATDGSGLKVIIDLGAVESVDALTVDLSEDRIYWTETRTSGEQIARHANLDGQDVRTLDLPKELKAVTNLVIYGGHIYGISNSELLFRVDKNGQNPVTLVTGQLPGSLSGLKVFSRSLQTTSPDHPCKSHSCQKFCFAVPTKENSLKATCGCPYGEKIGDDGVSCVDSSKEQPAFLPCKHNYFKCNIHTA